MVPTAFVMLDALPLTPNGKLDRKSLPKPDLRRLAVENAFVAPRTPNEEILAGIWANVLGRERVGIDDNFFELGGHSLLATQVISRIFDSFRVEVPLLRLFETPTIAGLTAAVDEIKARGDAQQAPALRRIARDAYRVGGVSLVVPHQRSK
jgi:acyl carrier protein